MIPLHHALNVNVMQAFLMQVFHCFASPSSRLQLIGLLNRYTTEPLFENHACVLAAHPLMSSILTSLLVDNSTTACTISLTTLTKLLPIFAVKDCPTLKHMLPQLFAILARILCWCERGAPAPVHSPVTQNFTSDEEHSATEGRYLVQAIEGSRVPDTNPDLQWERLELPFDSAAALGPSPQQYFTFLYYLFPCNLVAFLRDPIGYLAERNVERPYAVDWEDALDHEQIKARSEVELYRSSAKPYSADKLFAASSCSSSTSLTHRLSGTMRKPRLATPNSSRSMTQLELSQRAYCLSFEIRIWHGKAV